MKKELLIAVGVFFVVWIILTRRDAAALTAGGPTPAEQDAARKSLNTLSPEFWI